MIKIALVDDHIVLRKSLGVLIGKPECFSIVFEADNGRHLSEQLKTHPVPDIILLDIAMPVVDGVEIEVGRWPVSIIVLRVSHAGHVDLADVARARCPFRHRTHARHCG